MGNAGTAVNSVRTWGCSAWSRRRRLCRCSTYRLAGGQPGRRHYPAVQGLVPGPAPARATGSPLLAHHRPVRDHAELPQGVAHRTRGGLLLRGETLPQEPDRAIAQGEIGTADVGAAE